MGQVPCCHSALIAHYSHFVHIPSAGLWCHLVRAILGSSGLIASVEVSPERSFLY